MLRFLLRKNLKPKNGMDAIFGPRKGLSGNTGDFTRGKVEELKRKARSGACAGCAQIYKSNRF
jgi:hypothetical protein